MFTMLAADEVAREVIPIVAVAGGLGFAVIYTIVSAISGTLKARYREQSRRELAAYVAEGSISPEDAAKLMAAGRDDALNCGKRKA